MMSSRLVLILFVIIFVSESVVFSFHLFESSSYRLPNNTVPLSYDIHITTKANEENFKFNGTVIIALKVLTDTDRIILHSADLENLKISLVEKKSGHEFKNVLHDINAENSFVTIYSNSIPLKLKAGDEYILTISYKGNHRKKSRGFFASSFKDREGNTIWFATTHFEPTYARHAFPCYDEPAFKAKFTITLTHSSNFIALSNMPMDGEPIIGDDGTTTTTKFKQSPPMSTYIVAFIITNYNNISQKLKDVTHRVFSPQNSKVKGNFSLAIASKALHSLEDYFGIDYPLPKMDHISVPKLAYSAMENWGLIIYQYGSLLPSSNISDLYNLGTASVVVHEITHQWFGNLVSPKWWKWTWLSEGLTTFYSEKILQRMFPDWNVVEYALFKDGGDVVWSDSVWKSLTRDVETTNEIWGTFSLSSYFKAAYILRMFEHALTESTFKNGITLYLRKFQYSTAEEDDLFNSLQDAATEDKIRFFENSGQVREMMASWTNQEGIPIISVDRDYNAGTFKLTQNSNLEGRIGWFQKFINLFRSGETVYWWIPITFATSSNPNFFDTSTDLIFPNTWEILVDPSSVKKTLLEEDWLILNKQQIGLYRLKYDDKNWKLITEALKKDSKVIHAYNKAQLIRDAEYFMEQESLSENVFYDLLSYLKYEEEIFPWIEAVGVLRRLYNKLQLDNQKKFEEFKSFVRDLVANMYTKIDGIDDKNAPMTEYLRHRLFNLACDVELEECRVYIKKKFDVILSGNETDSILMKSFIYCQYIKSATDEEMEKFYQYLLAKRPYPFEERESYLVELMLCKPSEQLAYFILEYLDLDLMDLLSEAMSME